ncbi:hypothetical protein HK097_011390, partial [Rhizophlyctis rosea]
KVKTCYIWYTNDGIEYVAYRELKDAFREAFEVTGRAAVKHTEGKSKATKQGKADVGTYAALFGQKLGLHQHARASAGYNSKQFSLPRDAQLMLMDNVAFHKTGLRRSALSSVPILTSIRPGPPALDPEELRTPRRRKYQPGPPIRP